MRPAGNAFECLLFCGTPHDYTQNMDAVRFGRVLGVGARQAAKTVVAAVDAATATNSSGSATSTNSTAQAPASSSSRTAVNPEQPPVERSSPTGDVWRVRSQSQAKQQGVLHRTKRFRQAAFAPVVRLSGVLVLEVAGVFFGIFALYGLITVLRLRSEWHNGMPHHREWLGGVFMLAVFGYFCVSSFMRARRRERGR